MKRLFNFFALLGFVLAMLPSATPAYADNTSNIDVDVIINVVQQDNDGCGGCGIPAPAGPWAPLPPGSPIYSQPGVVQAGCPTTVEQVATMVGGNSADWVRIAPNGFKYRGARAALHVPGQFSGARIDWWLPNSGPNHGERGATYPNNWTPWVPEATLWIGDCNP